MSLVYGKNHRGPGDQRCVISLLFMYFDGDIVSQTDQVRPSNCRQHQQQKSHVLTVISYDHCVRYICLDIAFIILFLIYNLMEFT